VTAGGPPPIDDEDRDGKAAPPSDEAFVAPELRLGADIDVEDAPRPATAVRAERYRDVPSAPPVPHQTALPPLVLALLSPIAALLPARWRPRLHLDEAPLGAGAVVATILGVAAGALLYAHQILAMQARFFESAEHNMIDVIGEGSEETLLIIPATGVTLFLSAILSPLGAYGLYSLLEALARGVTLAAGGEILPHGPLVLADALTLRARRAIDERRLGPLVGDEVVRVGDTLEIHSCRPRPWPPGKVLLVDDAGWQLVASRREARFVYVFAPAPTQLIVRGTAIYRPDELLAARAAQQSWWQALKQGLSRR
jgi:hypothetical protein